ncbi:hypothetical protein GCM10023224_16170 [Streptomonospora halophila]|uniref:Uncharacterized protein n=1 Tax=Streptomonospora halophila TaxID=427369 RepID=A0ABP9GBD6_9ACTN
MASRPTAMLPLRRRHGHTTATGKPSPVLIDIYTDCNEHVGTADKRIAHERGLWHRTFSCLAFNPDTATVLLQKKSSGRYVFDRPDYADFHCRRLLPGR